MTPEQKQLVLAVVAILNASAVSSAAEVHRLLSGTASASVADVGHLLAILEGIGYRRGMHPEQVLAHITDMLAGIPVGELDTADAYIDPRT
ncbi:hypothetical protein [Nocardia brasiliensis]|uniref:hypothetical protein n=1 Tax=Nocardia brasiliensis TaxID=37326 RepID=UPI0024590051|nr:hypothetical protein [Nocardia brasiliensis]